MSDRLKKEVELVERRYGELELPADFSWLIVKRWSLPPGWSASETALLVAIPPGYSVTPPDNFSVAHDLRLAGGGTPGNAIGTHEHAGRQWLQLSYHVVYRADGWKPHEDVVSGDNLLTFLLGAEDRMGEAS